MESLVSNLQSTNQITAYMKDNHLVHYEQGILQEMIAAIKAGNQQQLDVSAVLVLRLGQLP